MRSCRNRTRTGYRNYRHNNDWVENLQKQNEERMKDTEVYKDWVNNLQKQNEERMKELEVYKDWVNNLQKQIEDMKR